jgi:hypothetical protein
MIIIGALLQTEILASNYWIEFSPKKFNNSITNDTLKFTASDINNGKSSISMSAEVAEAAKNELQKIGQGTIIELTMSGHKGIPGEDKNVKNIDLYKQNKAFRAGNSKSLSNVRFLGIYINELNSEINGDFLFTYEFGGSTPKKFSFDYYILNSKASNMDEFKNKDKVTVKKSPSLNVSSYTSSIKLEKGEYIYFFGGQGEFSLKSFQLVPELADTTLLVLIILSYFHMYHFPRKRQH